MAAFRKDEASTQGRGEVRTRTESFRTADDAQPGRGDVHFDEHVVDERSVSYIQLNAATVNGLLGLVLLGLESLLAVRFMLFAFGASTRSGFVRFELDVSHPFMRPFANAFANRTWDQGIIEPATLLAMGVYIMVFAFAMLLISSLMPQLTEHRGTERRQISHN